MFESPAFQHLLDSLARQTLHDPLDADVRLVVQGVYPLFHPRRDRWEEHCLLTDGHLLVRGLTHIGKATERVLALNDPRPDGPLVARHKAIMDGIYPPTSARGWDH